MIASVQIHSHKAAGMTTEELENAYSFWWDRWTWMTGSELDRQIALVYENALNHRREGAFAIADLHAHMAKNIQQAIDEQILDDILSEDDT